MTQCLVILGQLSRRAWCVLWVGLCAAALPVHAIGAACESGKGLPLQSVLPGLAVVHGQWPTLTKGQLAHAATTVVLGQGREITVVDPGPTQKVALALKATLQCHGHGRVVSLINTHAHAEQVLGNRAFPVPVAATAVTTASMKVRCPNCLQAMRQELGASALQGTRIAWPTRTLRDGQKFQAGGRSWLVKEMAMAHTESDLVLWSADERIALVGGLVDGERIPVLAQGRVLGWVQALDDLRAMQPKWLIGEHLVRGPDQEQVQAALQRQRAYLCGLVQFAWQGLERGWSEAEILQGARSHWLWRPEVVIQEAAWEQQHLFNQLRAWREIELLWMDQQAAPKACASVPDIAR